VRRLLGDARARLNGPAPEEDELPKTWLDPQEDTLLPPRRLWIGPRDSVHHYYRWVWEYLAYLTLLCGLRRDSAVLELGCGHGRTARGLLDLLRSPGRYCGLDVDRARVEDAQARIERRYPNFQFRWADIYNAHYNPRGSAPAASYVFPCADESFDVAYAASLFTHLLPEETRRYFQETRRVLRPGGRGLFSFFLLDHYRGAGTTVSPLYEFHHELPGGAAAVRDPEHPDALVGYRAEWLRAAALEAGLRVEGVLPGLWSESPGVAVNEQDLVLLVRD
jgi:SAM-dependent methyltransferase